MDPDTGLSDVMIFDSVIREAHQFSIAITDEPVETGVSMTDHAYVKSVPLVLEVRVSDTPFLDDATGLMVTSTIGANRAGGATLFTSKGEVRRTVNAWQAILDRAHAFSVFDVQTGLKLYQNMMFETGSAEQKVDSANVLKATIQLKPVLFATTSTVVYPARGPKKTKRQAGPVSDGGKKEAAKPTAAEAKPVSIGAGLLGITQAQLKARQRGM
jgi:hypothetical protein